VLGFLFSPPLCSELLRVALGTAALFFRVFCYPKMTAGEWCFSTEVQSQNYVFISVLLGCISLGALIHIFLLPWLKWWGMDGTYTPSFSSSLSLTHTNIHVCIFKETSSKLSYSPGQTTKAFVFSSFFSSSKFSFLSGFSRSRHSWWWDVTCFNHCCPLSGMSGNLAPGA